MIGNCTGKRLGTYTLDNTSTHICLYVVHKLLDLDLNPVPGLQDLTTLDVQETKGVNITKGVEEFRFREGVFGIILGLLECDASLRG